MAHNRRLTEEQLEQMAEWREAGQSFEWIGSRLGLSAKAIRWQCLRVGADHPLGHTFPACKTPMVVMRKGRAVRRFTPEEDALILRRQSEGARNADIARELGRWPHSILGRSMTLGMNADRAERRA